MRRHAEGHQSEEAAGAAATRDAERVEEAVEETLATTPSIRSTGGAISQQTITLEAHPATLIEGARASWARSPTGNRA